MISVILAVVSISPLLDAILTLSPSDIPSLLAVSSFISTYEDGANLFIPSTFPVMVLV